MAASLAERATEDGLHNVSAEVSDLREFRLPPASVDLVVSSVAGACGRPGSAGPLAPAGCPWAIGLITAHVVLIVLGYARAASTGAWHELWVLLTSYREILAAAAGFGLLIVAAVASYRHVRRRIKYETWWVIHLYVYLGLALAFAHQIFTGVSFIGHPLVRTLWILVWAATAGLVIVFRIAQPIWRSLRHRLQVVEVRREAPGVVR